MSQRINGRMANLRRGSSAFVAIVAVLLLVGAGVGGYWFYNTKMAGKGEPGTTKTAADSVKSFIGDLEDNLKKIVAEPAKADEQIAEVKKLADEDINDLTTQAKNAPADVKVKIIALVKEYQPKLQALVDAAYKVPGVQAKLEPIITKLMASLATLGAA